MLYSKTTGNGPLIIFVHGNSQNHHVWDDVVTDAALHNYTKLTPDLPGHGQSFRSEQPQTDYTLRAIAQHLANFINQYSAEGYIVVASSLATNYIAEKAHSLKNCKGVFLIGPSIIGENITPDEIVLPNPNFATTFSATVTDAELDALISDMAYHVSPKLRAQLKAMYLNTHPVLRTILGQSIATQDYGDEIGNLASQNLPVAIVYGTDEKIVFPDYMRNSQLKMWQNKIIKIPAAGHCCQFDEPGLIAGMIANFATQCFK